MTNSDKPSMMSSPSFNKLIYFFTGISLIGFLDAVYLSVSHYTGHISCSVVSGCQEVLVSQYSEIFGIPLALLGAAYYLFILINSLLYIDNQNKWSKLILSYLPIFGFVFSIYLVYLMFFVIEALCQYCLLSAGTSTLLFILGLIFIKKNKT
ncbi:MAG: vitamin K epoxide reductase family protein [Candidatus Komeilibacteria bacterium]|jgi:uncharacterized membrane protein|nr:vitamin K epoxide reductase family protein [Candidatus Komeilibacteria bacterium]MBT4447615.1 vitamin K epoxide reductase family protein [Candidatus Komeilibacteria bacterium]